MPAYLYIFDLDGTLADLNHRRKFVELQEGSPVRVRGYDGEAIYCGEFAPDTVWVEFPRTKTGKWAFHENDVTFKKDWDAFHAACVDDKPIQPVIDTFHRLMDGGADVWVWSGRMDTVRDKTIDWLATKLDIHSAWKDRLKMRPAGDYTPDDQLKESWLKAMSPEDRARLVMVFDDRDRVVAMWRRNGVVCAQVAPGDF